MAIIIDTELFLKNTEPYRWIKWVDALKYTELPREYLDDDGPKVYMDHDAYSNKNQICIRDTGKPGYTITVGEVVTERLFQKTLRIIEAAGRWLQTIRGRNLKEYQDKVGHHSYYI